jgi:hypothetical protein
MLYNSNKVISLYKDDFDLYTYNIYKLSKFLINKLLFNIYNNLIKRA